MAEFLKTNQTASQVPYDNSTSGLTADNVQDAIDETKSSNLSALVKDNAIAIATIELEKELIKDANGLATFDSDNTVNDIFYKQGDIFENIVSKNFQEALTGDLTSGSTTYIATDATNINIGEVFTVQDDNFKEKRLRVTNKVGNTITFTRIDEFGNAVAGGLVNSYIAANNGYIYTSWVGQALKDYEFNGTTSQAISGTGDVIASVETIVMELQFPQENSETVLSTNANANNVSGIIVNPTGQMRVSRGGVEDANYPTFPINKTEFKTIILRKTGIFYTAYVDGVAYTPTEQGLSTLQDGMTRISLGARITNDLFSDEKVRVLVITDLTIADQQAKDITNGTVELSSLITPANSEVYYDASQDSDVTIIENLGTATGYNLTATDVTLNEIPLPSIFAFTDKRDIITTYQDVNTAIIEAMYEDIGDDGSQIAEISITADDIEKPVAMEKYGSLVEITDKTYDFNGSTGQASGVGGDVFNASTIYSKFVARELIEGDGVYGVLLSFNNTTPGYIAYGDTTTGLTDESFVISGTTSGLTGFTGIPNINPGDVVEMFFRWTGTQYDLLLKVNNGNAIKYVGTLSVSHANLLAINKVAVGYREAVADPHAFIGSIRHILTATTITEQQGLDILNGDVELDSVLNKANSDVYYNATEDNDATIMENLGTKEGFDLTTTDVTLSNYRKIIQDKFAYVQETVGSKVVVTRTLNNVDADIRVVGKTGKVG